MKLQVTQTSTMAVPDGRGGWLNPAVDTSPSPVTLFRYKTLDDAEFKSIVDLDESGASPETLPYEKDSSQTQKQVNGALEREREFWWPKLAKEEDDEDEDGSTMKGRKTKTRTEVRTTEKTALTRHEKSVQRRERRLLKMDLEQREREATYREELHRMQMSVLDAEKKAHEAKRSYYVTKMGITEPSENQRRRTLP